MGTNNDVATSHSRVVLPSAQPMYRAAERWRDLSLIDDRSLFSGKPSDGAAAAQELVEAFVEQPDAGSGTFYDKLETQLAGVSAEAVQLAAELMFVYYLPVYTGAAKAETKRQQIRTILSWRKIGTSDLPEDLMKALTGGIVHPGTAYNSYRWKMFGYLIRFFRAVKGVPRVERAVVLTDWNVFQRLVDTLDDQSVWTQRYALEHLLFPDLVPASVSRDDRRAISRAFAPQFGVELEVAEIVRRLEPNMHYGDRACTALYHSPYRYQWRSPSPKLTEYASWAGRFLDAVPALRTAWEDRALATAEAVRAATEGRPFQEPLHRAMTGTAPAAEVFLAWAEDDNAARHALTAFTEFRGAEAIDRFLDRVPPEVLKSEADRLAVASVLVADQGSGQFPFWPPATVAATGRLADGPVPQPSATTGERYVLHLLGLDAIRVALGTPQKPWSDCLDAAVLADLLVRADRPAGWEDAEWRAFDVWRTGKAVALSNEATAAAAAKAPAPAEAVAAEASSSAFLEDLAAALSLDDDGIAWLEETLELLRHKRQLILQGPPGTGKTYLARELAGFLAGDPRRVTITQFHPGTSYEDFVQGLRPDPEEPTSFTVVDGPLLRIAEDARAHPDEVFVLLVDEINRGNIPAVFGELYYLLEYRDHVIRLTYGGDFSLPQNLFLIGTMNTADRSITALDSALRRRFYVRDLRPGETPVDGMLRNHLAQHDAELEWLADLLDRANSIIKDNDQHVGPSHFMGEDMDETWARRAWENTVMPTLREVFYSRSAILDELEFDSLKAAVTRTAGDAAAD